MVDSACLVAMELQRIKEHNVATTPTTDLLDTNSHNTRRGLVENQYIDCNYIVKKKNIISPWWG
jgi:hypothetical protein